MGYRFSIARIRPRHKKGGTRGWGGGPEGKGLGNPCSSTCSSRDCRYCIRSPDSFCCRSTSTSGKWVSTGASLNVGFNFHDVGCRLCRDSNNPDNDNPKQHNTNCTVKTDIKRTPPRHADVPPISSRGTAPFSRPGDDLYR